MRKKWFFISIVSIIVLSGCISQQSKNNKGLTRSDIDIKQLVSDYSKGNIEDQSASINSTQLIVTNKDNSQLTYALPKDEFFVSIAPYIEQTHPCATHSLTGCRGELINTEFEVFIEDSEGNILRDEKLTSNSHGFIDLWLPRDKEYRISITQNEKKVESTFSTFESDDTCITTMKLI
ncbi:CueP family metal-binding protein [Paenibacillus woosongensis]|uniref:CueP family metal-binding protein n=1 Tax=Paenibacillus woosongensis TaxID=307580 RepID=A0AA95I331_9BACL|nr:CueP family metal-binding protein [Paenibacillus woosongensis]WHX47002.1 CueP family metal-binding protein [Paenibacillus woosongensis]